MPVGYNESMKRTALFLRDDQLKKLEAIRVKTGAPIAESIRRAVDLYLKKTK